MKTRIISAVIGFPLFALTIVLGHNVIVVALFLLSIIGLNEYYNAFNNKYKCVKSVGYIATFALYAYLLAEKYIHINGSIMLLLIPCILIVLAGILVFTYPKYSVIDIFMTFVGVIYVPVLFSYIIEIRNMENGFILVWFIFLSAWGSDTSAYFAGKFLGKHKLAPVLSPNKTIEGAIGGVLGAVILCIIYTMVCHEWFDVLISNKFYVGLIGGIAACVSQIGDLVASAIKRFVDIKDFGKIIPGHGGILDRFDSILFTAPVVYILLILLSI